jgi:hypothetical protein
MPLAAPVTSAVLDAMSGPLEQLDGVAVGVVDVDAGRALVRAGGDAHHAVRTAAPARGQQRVGDGLDVLDVEAQVTAAVVGGA